MNSNEESDIIEAIIQIKVEGANLQIERLLDILDYDLNVMQGHQISLYLKEIRHMLITLSNGHLNETAR